MMIVFWLDSETNTADFQEFKDSELLAALEFANVLRKNKMRHVTISPSNEDCVTLPGVDAVTDGKTPDGQVYDWSKQHRGAGPRQVS